jgi:glycerophosphoryl diester phosphodiesterase
LLPGELKAEAAASAAAQAANHAVKYEHRAFPERITKLSVILQPKTVFTESSSLANFDEIIITDKDYISLADRLSKPVSYLLKNENDAEALRAAFPEGSFRILFDSFEPDIITKVKEDFPESATGFIVKTPYDMLRIREIQPFANVVIYDIANIVKLMINRESDQVDDNMLKQLRTSMKTCKEHGIECYCCNFSNNTDEELLKKLILIGTDGIVVKEEQAAEFALALERAEKKIMIDLARKAFQF